MKRVAVFVVTLATISSLLVPVIALAASSTISHAYNTAGSIAAGDIVGIVAQNTVKATNASSKNLVGVVVDTDQSLVSINGADNQVQVATSGTATVNVSTLNGDIKAGDQVAASAITGFGMLAAPGSHVIGLANSSFTSHTSGAQPESITDTTGRVHHIYAGTIPVTIAITTAPVVQLNGLQQFAKSLTGHTISTTRIIFAIVVSVVAIALLVVLVYGSIFGSIISIGRNPLSKGIIQRSLLGVLIMAGFVALVATVVVFLLLR